MGELKKWFQNWADSSIGSVMPEDSYGSDFSCGRISLGFPYLRPSRNRCDSYACHAALKIVFQLLNQAAKGRNLNNVNFYVDICSDSGYTWSLLHNSTALLKWGESDTKEDFVSVFN